jgi:hypothetical protein
MMTRPFRHDIGPGWPAPLAQSAERFHGKEKVVSSILTGGSLDVGASAGRRAATAPPVVQGCRALVAGAARLGGVAQLVRALGS